MIDLDELRTWHPELPEWEANAYASLAAIALQRRHAPGTTLHLSIGGSESSELLTWSPRPNSDAPMVDVNRATEDGAEGVALALLGNYYRQWRLVRRLQSIRNEGADWLAETESGQELVLEISGTDEGTLEPRLRTKRAQAKRAALARGARPAVSVVRFLEPKAMLEGL